MTRNSMRRRIAAATVAAGLALGATSAAPAFADKGGHGGERRAAAEQRSSEKRAAAERRAAEKRAAAERRAADKARRNPRFVVVGKVTAVGADTLTLLVKGGNQKAMRGQPATVKVPATAKVTRNGEKVALSAVQVGDHVAVQGKKVGSDLVARAVHAAAPDED